MVRLCVNTGGFGKDTQHYEADRLMIPLLLMELDELADGVLAHYKWMDAEFCTLLPLARVYWPV